MVGTWLGEIRSCSCLAVLPDSAWVLLNKIYQPFFTSMYVCARRECQKRATRLNSGIFMAAREKIAIASDNSVYDNFVASLNEEGCRV